MLESIASKVGVRVVPLNSRGEVKLFFPAKLTVGEFYLRLSTKKALALLLWIYFNKNSNEEV
jgi:hypothetical protein